MARNRPPSFDFYPEDFLAGTMHLHPTCIGIYIRLLCFQWSHGAVPLDDQRQLMQITGAMPDELAAHLPQVRDKFERGEDDGLYRNARLERERERKEQVSARCKEAIQKRWEKRKPTSAKGGSKDVKPPKDTAVDTSVCTRVSEDVCTKPDTRPLPPIGSGKLEEGSNQKEKRNASGASDEWIIPERLDTPKIRELLVDFETMRRSIRKPIRNLRSTSKILDQFDDVEHLQFALVTCIANEYQGLHPKYMPIKRSQPVQKTFAQMQIDNSIQAGEEWLAHG